MKKYLPFFLICIFFTSCYRMPEDGEVSMVPNVNNPNYTGQKNSTTKLMPGVEY